MTLETDLSSRLLVKLGGSLLTLPDLRSRLLALPELLQSEIDLVVGGGQAADLVRDLQRTHRMSDEDAHEVAIDTMDLNGHLVRRLLANDESDRIRVLDVRTCLRDLSLRFASSWDVTSDSIAAGFARRRGQSLVLMKSVPPPQSLAIAAARELVDREFLTASRGVAVSWLNLRTTDPVLVGIDP